MFFLKLLIVMDATKFFCFFFLSSFKAYLEIVFKNSILFSRIENTKNMLLNPIITMEF